MKREEVLRLIQKEIELKKFHKATIIQTGETVYLTGKIKYMGDRKFYIMLRPWNLKNLINYFEYHGIEREFDKTELGLYSAISEKQIII